MKTSSELRSMLQSINRKSYPAYKSLAGQYHFGDYILSIDHVQGDPFASPSRLSARISHDKAGFPSEYYGQEHRRIALQDYLTRQFSRRLDQFRFQAKGSGKSGLLSVSRCGQEILERTACSVTPQGITVRFEAGFPALGRTIQAEELEKILFDFLPKCISAAFFFRRLPAETVKSVVELTDDQAYIRERLSGLGLVAFVADGSVLPRESGVSDKPMKESVAFCSPDSLAVTLDLPHFGKLRGMGIRKGITLIAGGGYHGKSTLLKALELGVYNHIAGDGREFVITDDTAVKLRAEDGRRIKSTDISLFIRDLPNGRDTRSFSTEDASGSTSQAAAIVESLEAGSKLFLIDEDTSATNFMVRDDLMQQVITRDKEPITPFLERARDLYEQAGVSSILVVGSCGSYFFIADTILQMDCYRPQDITEYAKTICSRFEAPSTSAPDFSLPSGKREVPLFPDNAKSGEPRRQSGRRGREQEHAKIKLLGRDSFMIDHDVVELRYVEQLHDPEQTAALAYLLRYLREQGEKAEPAHALPALYAKIRQQGLASICGSSYVPAGLAMPRLQELFACINRC